MELASMLAGERFSDHPQSVCPVIGSFLRAYNDALDDRRRQDLYAYAARVVGSRASHDIELARRRRVAEWMAQVRTRRMTMRLLPGPLRALIQQRPPNGALGTHAVHAIRHHTDETHASALALVDELITLETPQQVDEAATGTDAQPAMVSASR
jgi:hypothetical protein